MSYSAPNGLSSNFSTADDVFPKSFDSLFFVFPGTDTAAQIGSDIQFMFSGDWLAPAGNDCDFITSDAVAAPSKKICSSIAAGWHQSKLKMVALSSPYSSISRQDVSPRSPWVNGLMRRVEPRSGWGRISVCDERYQADWKFFGPLLGVSQRSIWLGLVRADDSFNSAWAKFGDLLSDQTNGRWHGARPTDHAVKTSWNGHLITVFRPVPFSRPIGDLVNFYVVGGGVDCAMFSSSGYFPDIGDALYFQFDDVPYRIPFMPEDPFQYVVPKGSLANFSYFPRFEPLFDGNGKLVIDKAERCITPVLPWGNSAPLDRDAVLPWSRYSRPLNPGWGVVVPGGPVGPQPGEQIIIPVQRCYIMVNEILLARVDDGTPIPASQLRISIDCDSWLPSFSAIIPESARDAVMPSPSAVEVMALINGSEFRFLVDKIARSRQFGQRTVSISGRSLACELDAPYAVAAQRLNGAAMTAQQLIDDALQYTGYTQSWSIADWLVPAGALSLHGTPAEVAGHIAEAAGAVLSADWALRELRMLSRYPVKPWDFSSATPEYVIPAALAQTESVEWLEKPSYNVVYVSGIQQGILGRVKIAGTAGDKPAPMVTHPLLTHNDPIRERGLAILGDTGRKALMQISTPVLESTGVIDICRFVEFSDGSSTRRGIVRANSISVDWPTVRQTLTIEAAI